MSSRQTKYGECPLGKFAVNIDNGSVRYYSNDPVEACFGSDEFGTQGCNFADTSVEEFNLEKICHCPLDMTWDKYNRLRELYISKGTKPFTKPGFWEFVKKNYK